MVTPVFVCTGFLDSGKTTLVKETLMEQDWIEQGLTLLILCEEGEEEYSKEYLDSKEMAQLKVEAFEQLNSVFFKNCEKNYHPTQVVIEYNGMWEMERILDGNFPEDWFVGGIYSTVDGSSAELYLNNMRKTFMEPLKASNLIIFNRCDDSTDRIKYRRNLKALNPAVQVAFERKDGTMYENEKDVLPFDYSSSTVSIDDMDYGLWYIDALENPEHYLGKEILFTAKYCASAKPDQKYFVPGRHVMTCCEDDIQFLGFICNFKEDMAFEHGDWIHVKVSFDYGKHEMYGYDETGPILKLISIEQAKQPEIELVTFT